MMNTLHDNRKDYQYCKEALMTRWEAEKALEKFSYNEQEAARIYAIAKVKGWIVDAKRRVPGNQWNKTQTLHETTKPTIQCAG